MKSMFSFVAAVVIVGMSSVQAFAFNGPAKLAYLACQTQLSKFGGSTQITVVPNGQNAQGQMTFAISGSANGGMAQFIRMISPETATLSYAADMATYTGPNGLELNVITTTIGGSLKQVGVFKEATGFPSVQMDCKTQFTP